MDVLEALEARRSVRGFLPKSLAPETLRELFTAAQRTPSWCNIQPWRVWVTSGASTTKLTEAMVAAAIENPHGSSQIPFPPSYPEPYGSHRRECGKALYSAMGIARGDTAARDDAFLANYRAFGAPHVAVIAYDPHFGVYGALDVGCYVQSVLLAAQSLGLASCPQAALASYPRAIRSVLPIPDTLTILCGISFGYEDTRVAANGCRTSRAPLEDNVQLIG